MVRLITTDDHSTIQGWFSARGLKVVPETFAETGYIVPGVAACFVYKGDKIALIEGLVSNKEAGQNERREAVRHVLAACLEETFGCRVLATPTTPAACAWATKIGMVPSNKTFYVKKG